MHDLRGLQNPQSWSDVTGPMNFKKSGFFSENRAPGFLGHLAAIQAL